MDRQCFSFRKAAGLCLTTVLDCMVGETLPKSWHVVHSGNGHSVDYPKLPALEHTLSLGLVLSGMLVESSPL